ncbi:MAG: hypothetical protein D6736_17470 [Nitrospinota bacterium]|nr:MAG: hypothetical protein D6736_17470 [Nitrospinota bacterium]
MNSALVKKVVKLVMGWTFILLGIVGIFLPILQGFLFLVLGLLLLSSESKTARRILDYLRTRYPREYAKILALKTQYLQGEGFLMVFSTLGNLLLASGGISLGLFTHSATLFALGLFALSLGGVSLFTIKRFYTVVRLPQTPLAWNRRRRQCFWLLAGSIALLSINLTVVLVRVIYGLLHPVPLHSLPALSTGLLLMGTGYLALLLLIRRELKPLSSSLPSRSHVMALAFPPVMALGNTGLGTLGTLLSALTGTPLFDLGTALLGCGFLAGLGIKITRDYLSSFVQSEVTASTYQACYRLLKQSPHVQEVFSLHLLPLAFHQKAVLVQLQLSPALSPEELNQSHQQIEEAIKANIPSCSRVFVIPLTPAIDATNQV